MFKIPEPLPCPGCGGTGRLREPEKRRGKAGWLYHGTMSSSSTGVLCYKCGLKVELGWEGGKPDVPDKLRGWARINWRRSKALQIAVERWNALPRREEKPCPSTKPRKTKQPALPP